MATTDVTKYEFLDRQGVLDLAEAILGSVNTRIEERIVQKVDAESDDKHVPSAAAVYAAISGVKGTKMKVHTGNINDVEPEENVIYLQRDDEADITWTMYVYASVAKTVEDEDGVSTTETEQKWISIGTTDLTLANYWAKTDVEEMKAALGVDELAASVEDKVSADQMIAFTKDDITSLVKQAYDNTEILNPKDPEESDTSGEDTQE